MFDEETFDLFDHSDTSCDRKADETVPAVRGRSRLSRIISTLCCCCGREKRAVAVTSDGDQPSPGSSGTPELKTSSNPEQPAPEQRPRSKLANLVSRVFCCGRKRDRNAQQPVPVQGDGKQPESAKTSRSSEALRSPKRGKPGPKIIPLSQLAVTRHWCLSVNARYQHIRQLRAQTILKLSGVDDDLLMVSRGIFLSQKKSERKDPQLREQLLRREWKTKLNGLYFDYTMLLPKAIRAEKSLVQLRLYNKME